jgi:large subunit ribosomal protein L7/L12
MFMPQAGGGGRAGGADEVVEAPPPVVEEVKVKDSFDLKLAGFSATAKIKIIKEVRTITGLGLKEVFFVI